MKEMLDNIAHQWRQPLAQINSTVGAIDKLLYDKNVHDPLLEEKLQEIEALTKYMSNTIDDFKGYFANNNSKAKVFLRDVVEQSIAIVRANLEENQIAIETKMDMNYECECYANELKQIIVVLFNNAKDALLDRNVYQANIEVEIALNDGEYAINIYDNAGGISKSVREKMFEPYYTTKHKSQGSGLGLYMSRKIIRERFHGEINVSNVNKGSRFSIVFPKENLS